MVQTFRPIDLEVYAYVDQALQNISKNNSVNAPIYIPTRHRAGRTTTNKLLDQDNLPYILAVEPHDYKDYAKYHSANNLLKLPTDDIGISDSRNYCVDHAKENGAQYAWQIDDDIRTLTYRVKGERSTTTLKPLLSIVENVTSRFTNVGAASIPSNAFIFSFDAKPPIDYNQMVYGIQLLRTDTGIRWRKGMPNDPDRTLQLLTTGWSTIVARRFGQTSPPPMKQKGGLTDTEYADGGRLQRFERLVRTWPGAYKIGYMKDGTPRLISRNPYGKFTQPPTTTNRRRYNL